MEEQLKFLLTNVNDWLKFAEAKNGTLLATAIAAVIGTLTLEGLGPWVVLYLYLIAVPLLVFAAITCLLSFLPVIKLPLLQAGNTNGSISLIFFGDAARYDAETYLDSLYAKNGIETQTHKGIELDFATQIVVNSRIALIKFQLFALALWLTVAAVFTPIVAIGLFLFSRSKGKGIKK